MILIKFICFMLLVALYQCRLPDKVFCVNDKCTDPISKAQTALLVNAGEPGFLSFPAKAEALVYMKSADADPDIWYASINGKFGFVNKNFVREIKIFQKKENLVVVPLESLNLQPHVQPNKVQQPHEVIEGTTIFTTEATVPESFTETPQQLSENETPSLKNVSPEVLVEQNQSVDSVNNNSIENDHINIHVNAEQIDNIKTMEQDQESATNMYEITDEDEVIYINETDLLEELSQEDSDKNFQSEIAEVSSHEAIVESTSEENSITVSVRDSSTKEEHLQKKLTNSEAVEKPDQNTSSNLLKQTIETNVVLEANNILNTPPTDFEKTEINLDTFTENEKNVNGINNETQNTDGSKSYNTQESFSAPVNEHLSSKNSIFEKNSQIPQTKLEETNVPAGFNSNVQSSTESLDTTTSTPKTQENNNLYDTNPEPHIIPDSSRVYQYSTETPTLQSQQDVNTVVEISSNVQSPTESSTATTTSTPKAQENLYDPNSEPHFIPDSSRVYRYSTETPTLQSPQDVNNVKTYNHNTLDFVNKQGNSDNYLSDNLPEQSTEQPIDLESVDYIQSTSTSPNDITEPTEPSTEGDAGTSQGDNLENTKSIFSNLYSTLLGLWPSGVEQPTTESLFNTDSIQKKQDTDNGYSFIKFITAPFTGLSEESKAIFPAGGQSCYSEDYCDGTSNEKNNRFLTFLVTTALSVLLFTLGYYYIDNRRQDGKLIATINTLQRDLLFTSKECEILKEELTTTKTKLAGIEDSSFGMDDMVQSLKEEINELKTQNERLRKSLDDNEKLLRVSENTAGELQNTLSEVENTLSELLAERANTEEQIAELNGKIQAFEEELIEVTRDRDNYQLKFVSADTALEEAKKQTKKLEEITQKLTDANNTIELQRHEITALKDAIKDLKSGASSNVDVTSFIDHTEIKAKLSKALQEKESFEKKFEVELKERTRLSEELQITKESLQTTSQQANDALTRLEVLGKYFQERESELMKELSTKESLWLSKQGESVSTVEKIELLQQDLQRYKEKCDALTLELAEQESLRRTAVSEVEARAHSAWLEARAAKREADAARDEAATLRRKLASVAADGAASPLHKVSSPLDSADGVVPPLPPLAFLPPPLLPPLPHGPPPPLLPPLPRPPPLGRLPSPHPPRYSERRYSPDSRYSPESRYSPGSRYSPETVRYSPDSRYSPRMRRSPYSPRSRRRSRERYEEGRSSRSRNAPPMDTETEYNSDSPSRQPRRRRRYSRHSGPSSGSGCSSESDK